MKIHILQTKTVTYQFYDLNTALNFYVTNRDGAVLLEELDNGDYLIHSKTNNGNPELIQKEEVLNLISQ